MTAGEMLPRILIVDHFDSYTLNLLSLLAAIAASDLELARKVVVLPHTHVLLSSQERFRQDVLPHFDALILSPGPGSPDKAADFGFGLEYLRNAPHYRLPTLGVCLGHQGIAAAFGGNVKRAKSVQHGMVSKLQYPSGKALGDGIFAGVAAATRVTRYNSLTVDSDSLPDCLQVTAFADDPANLVADPMCSDLIRSRATSPDVAASERCILGLAHKTLPLWGVQFHPESIESHQGEHMLRNFLRLSSMAGTRVDEDSFCTISRNVRIPTSLQSEGEKYVASTVRQRPNGLVKKHFRLLQHSFSAHPALEGNQDYVFQQLTREDGLKSSHGSIWLDSARKGDPQTNFSYMSKPTFSLAYHRAQRRVGLYESSRGNWMYAPLPAHFDTFWHYMDALQKDMDRSSSYDLEDLPSKSRFRCGFVGYLGYELKSESLGLQADETLSFDDGGATPAAEFGFCDAVLQFDHSSGRWTASLLVQTQEIGAQEGDAPLLHQLQSLRNGSPLGMSEGQASAWIERVNRILATPEPSTALPSHDVEAAAQLPALRPLDSCTDYKAKVEAARALIARGESYELCLTTQFRAEMPSTHEDHFNLYCNLRVKNPAPYAAYIELPDLPSSYDTESAQSGDLVVPLRTRLGRAILSSSPERFLSKSTTGGVEMKPIKGTVPRAGYGRGEKNSIAERGQLWAEREDDRRRSLLEADPKERAENLMIVDLIRADLMSFCLPSTVRVPLLMKVESYQSVHQLVTTVQGQAKEDVGPVEALRRCFPPGSMTGAPKRRSVTLLERLEGKSRSAASATKSKAGLRQSLVAQAICGHEDDRRPLSPQENQREWDLSHRPRGVYSGALGWIGIDGATDFSVVIRTAVVSGDGKVSIGAGGAITYLSDADKEWSEVLHKVQALGKVQDAD